MIEKVHCCDWDYCNYNMSTSLINKNKYKSSDNERGEAKGEIFVQPGKIGVNGSIYNTIENPVWYKPLPGYGGKNYKYAGNKNSRYLVKENDKYSGNKNNKNVSITTDIVNTTDKNNNIYNFNIDGNSIDNDGIFDILSQINGKLIGKIVGNITHKICKNKYNCSKEDTRSEEVFKLGESKKFQPEKGFYMNYSETVKLPNNNIFKFLFLVVIFVIH